MYIGYGLGLLVSPIILGLIFYLVFMPLGLIMRLFKRDELELKLVTRNSYWKIRDTKTPLPDNFKFQF